MVGRPAVIGAHQRVHVFLLFMGIWAVQHSVARQSLKIIETEFHCTAAGDRFLSRVVVALEKMILFSQDKNFVLALQHSDGAIL